MEDTLRVTGYICKDADVKNCLNPCFNGRYSQSGLYQSCTVNLFLVLILVLMEDTLRGDAVVIRLCDIRS